MVQSALSQRPQRLERELGVLQLDPTTDHVELTPARSAFLIEARQILASVDRAALAVQRAASWAPGLWVGVRHASYDSMPQFPREVQQNPEPDFRQVGAGVPEKFRQLAGGRLDVGIGRASLAPPEVTAEVLRLDSPGVLVPEGHRLVAWQEVPVAKLAAQPAPSRGSCRGGVGTP